MPNLLTTREAADRCGCSPDTFLKRSKRANVHPLELRTTQRAGRCYYWRAADVAVVAQAAHPGGTAPKPATKKEERAIATDRAARKLLIRAQQLERWRQYYRTRAEARAANRTTTTNPPRTA